MWPRLREKDPLTSYPFTPFSENCFTVAFIWLGLVLLFWSYLGFTAYSRKPEKQKQAQPAEKNITLQ
jgi:hypothetical protein